MNKEPIGLYIFRFLMGFLILAFMAMLYWSSVNIEEEIEEIQKQLNEQENQLFETRLEIQKSRESTLKLLLENRLNPSFTQESQNVSTQVPLPEKHYENLLKSDDFYTTTLPQLLPNDFKAHGTRHIATVGLPHNFHPFSNWSLVSSLNSMCNGTVATGQFGKYETMAPYFAVKLEERASDQIGVPEFWVHLRDDIEWQAIKQNIFPDEIDLDAHFLRSHPVTAHDFKFYFDAIMNPYIQEAGAVSLRNYLGDIEEFRVIDDRTFVVKWKPSVINGENKIKYTAKQLTGSLKPLPRFVYQYFPDGTKIVQDDSDPQTYRNNSIWAQNFSEHWAKNIIVSCGAWIFDGASEKMIRLKRNPEFFNRYAALVEEIQMHIKDSPDAIWQDFKAGKIDTYELRPDQLIELDEFLHSDAYAKQKTEQLTIQRLDYVNRAYVYVGWNMQKALFSSEKIRAALTMAIDRRRIIDQNLNKMGIEITGPFFRNSPSYDEEVDAWPFDPRQAKKLLESEGWYDGTGDGVRNKIIDGKQESFTFDLTYYVKNPTAKANCEYIRTALKDIGVICHLNGVDLADLDSTFSEKKFDALYLGWGLGTPPEEPKQLWHSSGAKEKGSSNAVGFANHEADQIIEDLQYEYDHKKRLKLYHRFHQIIHAESPYTFLYTPKSTLLYREYVKNVFIPAARQKLVPGANIAEPDSSIFWLDPYKPG